MPKTREASAKRAKTASEKAGVRDSAIPTDWLALALLHHDQIRSAFVRAAQAPAGGSRLAAFKGLAILLNGHSVAEEIVLYPVLASGKPKAGAGLYAEQSEAKVEMAKLEMLDPAAGDWTVQLEAIRAAVEEHMMEEEQTWFPAIKASDVNQAKLTARYCEEFDRYTRTGHASTNAAWDAPPRRLLA